jgi:hypothetical protein
MKEVCGKFYEVVVGSEPHSLNASALRRIAVVHVPFHCNEL